MPAEFLNVSQPERMGVNPQRWLRALQLGEALQRSGELPTLSFQLQLRGQATPVASWGKLRPDSGEHVDDQTCYLVASLTKPVLATAVVMLAESGQIGLNQRVVDLLPEFDETPKRPITVRHLLTHTSGLPDMLPNNQKLRMEQAPLSRFVQGTCGVSLDFPPGRGCQYQSMGYALLGEIISRVTGCPYGEYIRQRIFHPLGMYHSWLGLPDELYGKLPIAEVIVPEEQRLGYDWNWNSRYWHGFGAPWGGLICTVSDLSRFLRLHLNDGAGPGGRLLSSTSIQLATTNRLADFEAIPELERRIRGWGFGWRMNWRDHRGSFGDLLSPQSYGHWGATGTLYWVDPAQQAAAVIVSTQPLGKELSPLTRLSNAILAAIE